MALRGHEHQVLQPPQKEYIAPAPNLVFTAPPLSFGVGHSLPFAARIGVELSALAPKMWVIDRVPPEPDTIGPLGFMNNPGAAP